MAPAGAGKDPLTEALDQGTPESWIPKEKGEEIRGTVVGLDQGYSQMSGITPILVIDTGDGVLRSIWLYGDVLKNLMRRVRPVPGEAIAVRFEGKRKSKNPRPGTSGEYNDWRVAVDRPVQQSGIDWESALGPRTTPEAAAPDAQEEIPF